MLKPALNGWRGSGGAREQRSDGATRPGVGVAAEALYRIESGGLGDCSAVLPLPDVTSQCRGNLPIGMVVNRQL